MEECYLVTKSNTPPWVFFMFFKLYEWYQIAQSTSYMVFENYVDVYRGVFRALSGIHDGTF